LDKGHRKKEKLFGPIAMVDGVRNWLECSKSKPNKKRQAVRSAKKEGRGGMGRIGEH